MTAPARLMVADSFLLESGRVVGFAAHRERFLRAVRTLHGAEAASAAEHLVERFGTEAPRTGRWFPRWESTGTGARWRLRPAPDPRWTLRLAPEPVPDPREHPRVKGPDIERLAGALWRWQAIGYDDALLADGDQALETTTCTLVARTADGWVTPAGARLDSTTLGWFENQTHVTYRTLTCNDALAAAGRGDLWALNALHGPRLVTTTPRREEILVAGPVGPREHDAAPASDLAEWRARWAESAEELP